MRWLPILLCTGLAYGFIGPAAGQTLEQRMSELRVRQERDAARDLDAVLQRSVYDRMHNVIDRVQIEGAAAREALQWWARTTHISLVINWDAMEMEGLDPETIIDLDLQHVRADRVLGLLLRAVSAGSGPGAGLAGRGVDFVFDVEPGYVQVLTKAQANRMPVTLVYDVADLVVEVPYFDDAPRLDLREALSNTTAGGGGGGSSPSLFRDEDTRDRPTTPTRQQRGEALAQLIRDTLEPTLWRANGGEHGAIRYLDGRLIVTAPKYVHRQIGIPLRSRALPMIGGVVEAPEPVDVDVDVDVDVEAESGENPG